MHDRSALGPADVTDQQLTRMVADLLGSDPASTHVIESGAQPVDYDLPAITTAGRHWVHGRARVSGQEHPWRIFVKHVQSWARSPFFEMVPPEVREMAAAGVPWRTEALAYRSDLGDRLPEGLRMPRALGVFDLDEASASVWLEEVPVEARSWDVARKAEAAQLLGRLAVDPRVAVLRDVGEFGWHQRMYVEGRVQMQVLPLLRDEGVWHHPLVAGSFGADLRDRLLAAVDRLPALAEELYAMPVATAHGDACPNNLLSRADSDGFVLIDYGFWGPNSIGYDLSQLLVGDVQIGERTADDLREVDETIVEAYVEGLRAEGCDLPVDVVRRAHALALFVFSGLSALPFEQLGDEPTPELLAMATQRAAIASYSLELLDATAG